MKKDEFINLLDKLEIPVNEGIQYLENNNNYPRIVYFEYVWDDIEASGQSYDTVVTYQVSFRSLKPRDKKLLELKKILNKKDIHPRIYHEFIENKREWHSYFSIDLIENINE